MSCCEDIQVTTKVKARILPNNILQIQVNDSISKVQLPIVSGGSGEQIDYITISATNNQVLFPSAVPSGKFLETITINGEHYFINTDFTVTGTALAWINTDFSLEPSDTIILWIKTI